MFVFNEPNNFMAGLKSPTSKSIYMEANIFVEKWSSIIYVLFTKASVPIMILPLLILSYFLYFTTDLGRNAFQLPFVIW